MLASWHVVPTTSFVPAASGSRLVQSQAASGAMFALSRCCRGLRHLCQRTIDNPVLRGRPDVSVCASARHFAARAVATKEDVGVDANTANKVRSGYQ